MTRWEYRYESFGGDRLAPDTENWLEREGWRVLDAARPGRKLTDKLNALGVEGWEIISIKADEALRVGGGTSRDWHVFMKRPLPPGT